MFKNARKIIMGATLALVMGVSVVGVNAETPKEEGPFYQETEINITVEEVEIEEPGDGGDGGDGGSNKGKLSIWLKPSLMNFEGKFKEEGYTLPLKSGGDKGTENEHKHRRIAIADVRANEIGWSLKANLTSLKGVNGTIDDGYKLDMTTTLGKYKTDDNGQAIENPKTIDFTNNNGVETIDPKNNISIEPGAAKTILRTNIEENTRPGKGYSAAELNDINMHFETGKGLAGDFSGQVEWTLTDSVK